MVDERRFLDTFVVDVPPGSVIASLTTGGEAERSPRRGVDAEGTMSVAHGKLRLAPLVRRGWERVGISSPPCELQPCDVAAFVVLNAHASSESLPLEEWRTRLGVWLRGSGSDSIPSRFRSLVLRRRRGAASIERPMHGRRRQTEAGHDRFDCSINQMVGLFSTEVPTGPGDAVAAIATRRLGPRNGRLRGG